MTVPLHVVGDSHSRLFRGLRWTSVHWVGPVTMHRLGRDGVEGLSSLREWLDVRGRTSARNWLATILPGQIVLWSCGEIDVRCHLAQQTEARTDAVSQLAGAFLRMVRQFGQLTGTRQAVCSLPPAMDTRNPAYPCIGSLTRRRDLTDELNSSLRSGCLASGVAYVDLFPLVASADRGIVPRMAADPVHLGRDALHAARRALSSALGEDYAPRSRPPAR